MTRAAVLALCMIGASLTGSCARVTTISVHDLPGGAGDRMRIFSVSGSGRVVIPSVWVRQNRQELGDVSVRFAPSNNGSDILLPGSVLGPASADHAELIFVLDTGGEFFVALDRRSARHVGATVISEASPRGSITVLGPAPVRQAALLRLNVPPIEAGPIDASIRAGNLRHPPMLGHKFVMLTGGVIIDRASGVCTILAPTHRDLARPVPEGWVAVPWTSRVPEAVVTQRERATGEPARFLRSIPVSIGGTEYTATLDTGAGNAVTPLRPLDIDRLIDNSYRSERIRICAFGQAGMGRSVRLSEPLSVGPLRIENARLELLDDESLSEHWGSHSADLVIGLAALGDVAVWFDPEAEVVRFWTGDGPPVLPTDTEERTPGSRSHRLEGIPDGR